MHKYVIFLTVGIPVRDELYLSSICGKEVIRSPHLIDAARFDTAAQAYKFGARHELDDWKVGVR